MLLRELSSSLGIPWTLRVNGAAMNVFNAPNFRLSASSPAARGFLRRGATDFHRAMRLAGDLPAREGSWHADDHRQVLPRGWGSEAAKRALLAALAGEHQVPVRLMLATYELNAENTPGAAPVLAAAGLPAVLDSDCLLTYEGEVLARNEPAPQRYLHQERIEPSQIAAYRLAVFQRHLWAWTQARGVEPAFAWRVRQQCVDARMQGV
jgi:hypothetical protein